MRTLLLVALGLVPSLSLAAEEPRDPPVVEAKPPARLRRWQLSLDPFVPTLGGKAVTLGSALRGSFEIVGGFGLTASVGANWLRLGGDLGSPGEVLVTDFAGLLGVQFAPTFGRFHPFVRAGALLVASSHLMTPPVDARPAVFLSTGLRAGLGASVGLGVRIIPLLRVVVEVQYQAIPANVSQVAGCDEADLLAMDLELRAGRDPSAAAVKSACSQERFSGRDENADRRANVPLALSLVRTPAGEFAHRFSPMVGIELAF